MGEPGEAEACEERDEEAEGHLHLGLVTVWLRDDVDVEADGEEWNAGEHEGGGGEEAQMGGRAEAVVEEP